MAREMNVFQDGRDFYLGDEDTLTQTVTFPGRVPDMDIAAAENARDWFVKIWCAQNDVAPIFEGETF